MVKIDGKTGKNPKIKILVIFITNSSDTCEIGVHGQKLIQNLKKYQIL